jgi:phage gp36-like protein
MSYSTPTLFKTRVGPRICAQLSSESGTSPTDATIQGWLTAAAADIDIRVGNRYVAPVAAPAAIVLQLGGLEAQIAEWFGWVYRGIGDQESAASAAKVGYDAAMKFLDAVMNGDADLPGVAPRPEDLVDGKPAGWLSNDVVYSKTTFRSF